MMMSTNNELLRKILKHSDLEGMFEVPDNIDKLTITDARVSEDPYISVTGEILYQLSQNKNVNANSVYTTVQQLLKSKL
jgi:hypothetical protein